MLKGQAVAAELLADGTTWVVGIGTVLASASDLCDEHFLKRRLSKFVRPKIGYIGGPLVLGVNVQLVWHHAA